MTALRKDTPADPPTIIIEDPTPLGLNSPRAGARRVFWLIKNDANEWNWLMKGWILPTIGKGK